MSRAVEQDLYDTEEKLFISMKFFYILSGCYRNQNISRISEVN